MAFEESAPVPYVPLIASVPPQAPEAVHEVALVEDQLKVETLPLDRLVGLALSVTVGGLLAVTVTVADWLTLPPVPVQVKV